PVGAIAGERPTGIEFEAEPLGLWSGEAEREEDEIGFEDVCGARGGDPPAVEELRLGDLDPAYSTVPVADESRGRGQVATHAALLVRTLDLEAPRHRRPGIVLAALGRRFRTDRQGRYRGGLLAQRRAEAVGAGVPAADDDHVLAGGVDRRDGLLPRLHPVRGHEVVHGEFDSVE